MKRMRTTISCKKLKEFGIRPLTRVSSRLFTRVELEEKNNAIYIYYYPTWLCKAIEFLLLPVMIVLEGAPEAWSDFISYSPNKAAYYDYFQKDNKYYESLQSYMEK